MTHIDSDRKTSRLSFIAYADQIEALDKYAEDKETHINNLLRQAIDAYLETIKEENK